ncbi:MAG: ABC transporter ATP-binding protein [Chloroflexi bacterium]|nr:MAG: ABC transporter ATP-binding protein [Chloroflexota bacterium]
MDPILTVEGLHKQFKLDSVTTVHAVNGVDFHLAPREAVGLVGESGCGKSTTARCIVRLEQVTRGKILFQGQEITALSQREFRPVRRSIQMVFQDPMMSLNPRLTVRQTVREPLLVHHLAPTQGQMNERIEEIMALVNLELKFLDRSPRQLSGGQRQRVGIARALITHPKLVVLDEPTSSLDMSIRIHIIDLLRRLQDQMGITYLFISHDLSTVRYLCQRVLVMYLGRVVEMGPVDEIFDRPLHHYTQALLSAIPIPDPKVRRQRIILKGEPPSLTRLPPGCGFADRCEFAAGSCREEGPTLHDVGNDHWVACRYAAGLRG